MRPTSTSAPRSEAWFAVLPHAVFDVSWVSRAASAPGFWLRKFRGLTPNGTHFDQVTRSVSEGNKGKRLMLSPSLTLRVSKVSAIGLTPPGSPKLPRRERLTLGRVGFYWPSTILARSLCVVCLVALSGGSAVAQQSIVGKRVVVIKDKAPLAVSGQTAATAKECTVFTVDKVEGEWLWIKSERAYLRRGDVVPFEDAIAHYTRLLETNQTANNYWNRAQIWRLKGELDIALGDMHDAIRLNSTESAWFHGRGILWKNKKDYDKAIADYSEAIRLNPKSGRAYTARGLAWSAKKDYDKAIADYDEALKHQDPNAKDSPLNESDITGGDSIAMVNSRALTFSGRGWAWGNKKNYDKAIADYEEAIWLDPKFLYPLNGLAWLRATCPNEKHRNGQQAVEYATKACELTAWKREDYLDTLAAAYAEAGDFDKAVEWQKKGMNLAPADQKADYESRLKLYRNHQPFRDTTK